MASTSDGRAGGSSTAAGGGSSKGGREKSKQRSIKFLVIGDHNTGKTCLIRRYVYGLFEPESTEATIAMDIAVKHVRVAGEVYKIQIWDIAGQDRFIGMADMYYRNSEAAIVVFDITRKKTLDNARRWKQDVDCKAFLSNGEAIPCVLFANKWDLAHQAEVTDSELDDFCERNDFVGWFSTSAKTELNVKKGVNFMVSRTVENRRALMAAARLTSEDDYDYGDYRGSLDSGKGRTDGIVDLKKRAGSTTDSRGRSQSSSCCASHSSASD